MIEILVGLIVIFLLICFSWTGVYLLELEIDLIEPPRIIKLIGIIEIIATCIATILSIAYVIGGLSLEG